MDNRIFSQQVSDRILKISPDELAELHEIRFANGMKIISNSRPVQPLNGRAVTQFWEILLRKSIYWKYLWNFTVKLIELVQGKTYFKTSSTSYMGAKMLESQISDLRSNLDFEA